MQTGEQKLIARAAKGDGRAFEELIAPQEKRMYAVALRMCGNRDDAQDCLQDAMLRVFRALPNFKGESAFSTWAYRITVNACLDAIRRRKSKPNSSLDDLLDEGYSPQADESETPEEQLLARERKRTVMEAIEELPEDMRSAVVLRDVDGFSYEDIAKMLEINVGTVKSRISRARERLRQKLLTQPELFGKHGVK